MFPVEMKIPFNKPYLSGKETNYIMESVLSGKISGDGLFTKKCHAFFETKYKFKKALLVTSCTDALEMAAILANIKPGDEVIAPSFTFVSTVNAFVLRGAKIVFVDSKDEHPGIDENGIEKVITSKTRVIVPVHYAGIACDMDNIMHIAKQRNLLVVEDAAQAIDSWYKGKPLGSIGTFGAFSFHETKNISSGEGGLITVNDEKYIERAEIVREKGTNRSAFFRGEVDKYHWIDIGSSFLPSDIIAAFLYAQLENLNKIQNKRQLIWNTYHSGLELLEKHGKIIRPQFPEYATNNAHLYYIICQSLDIRTALIKHLSENDILAVFHYLPLHKSPYYKEKHDGRELKNAERYADCLLRLPMYYELSETDQDRIISCIYDFFKK